MPVQTPKLPPHDTPGRCSFYGQMLSDNEGFILGDVFEGPLQGSYTPTISMTGLREMAKRYGGMWHAAEYEELQAQIVQLEHEKAQLADELADADAILDGHDGLVKRGYRLTRAPGRPKKPTNKEDQ